MSGGWTLAKGKRGGNLSCVDNALTILTQHPDWKDVLAWDEFSGIVITTRVPPWDENDAPANVQPGPWADDATTRTRVWLGRKYDVRLSARDVDAVVIAAAKRRLVHPVREYLRSVKWDGKLRLDRWLIDYCGASDTEYTRAVSAKWPISAVARVERPGCQADHMLMLQGDPGLRKSSVLRALAVRDEWFHDEVNTRDKDGKIALQGVWILEDAELAGLKRADRTTNNAFITRRGEKYRAPYEKWDARQLRQCVFAATTNDEEILTDPVGARRFWFIRVLRIELPGLIDARDQLWAEAFARFGADEAWHIEDRGLLCEFATQQEARRIPDTWEEPVASWLKSGRDARGEAGVTTHDVLCGALNVSADRMTRDAEMRASDVLHTLGWEKCPTLHKRDAARIRVFFPRNNGCPRHRGLDVGREKRGEGEVVQVVQVVQPPKSTNETDAQPSGSELLQVAVGRHVQGAAQHVVRRDPARTNGGAR